MLLVPFAVAALILLLGVARPEFRKFRAIGFIFYFSMANFAIFLSTIYFIIGRRVTVWTPTRR